MKLLKNILFILLLFISVLKTAQLITIQAGEVIPKLKESKKTLYIGDNTYQVSLVNLSPGASKTFKSNHTSVVKVDSNGRLTPISAGSAVITVTVKQNGKSHSLKSVITVKNPYIFITNKISDIRAGNKYNFTIKSAGLKDTDIVWWVSDKSLASIDFYTGEFIAKKAGQLKVTAKDRNSGRTSTCYINILIADSPFSISNKISDFWTDVDYKFKTIGTDSEVLWSSSDDTIASIDNNGMFVGKKQGIVTITAEDVKSGAISTCSVNVKHVPETPEEVFKIRYYQGELRINGWNDTSYTEIRIPEKINGEKVSGIDTRVFQEHPNLKVVVIPAYSPNYNLRNCENLESVVVLNRDKGLYVDDNMYCDSLKEFIAPYSCEMLFGDLCFRMNKNLRTVILPEGSTFQENLFNYNENLNITVPDSIDKLENLAAYCNNMRVTIPASVTVLEENVFFDCKNITIITPKGSAAEEYAKAKNIPYENY